MYVHNHIPIYLIRQAAPERSTPLTNTARMAPKEQQLLADGSISCDDTMG